MSVRTRIRWRYSSFDVEYNLRKSSSVLGKYSAVQRARRVMGKHSLRRATERKWKLELIEREHTRDPRWMFSENIRSAARHRVLFYRAESALSRQKEPGSPGKYESIRGDPWQGGIGGGPRGKCLPSQRNVFSRRERFFFPTASRGKTFKHSRRLVNV